jgi:hypothetical protein
MPSLAELYEQHARECIQSADNPKYREMLLKMEREWTQAATTLRASNGSAAEERES